MNLIYVGFYYPNRMMEELSKTKSVVDFPGFTFQSALLSGLDTYYPELRVVSSAYMSAYPKNKKILYHKQFFSHRGDNSGRDVFTGLLNLPVIKEVSKFLRIRKWLKRSLRKDDANVVLCYEAHTPFLLAIVSLKNYISKACLIVPDLPEFMTGRKNKMYLFAKKIDYKIINNAIKSFDCFVLFSPYMTERLAIGNKPKVQLEGIYRENLQIGAVEKENNKTILYTGNLGVRTGILDLLNAFDQIDLPNYRLWIRGNGEMMKEEILRRQKNDSRIIYFEPMSKEDLLRLQRRATVLVNPIRPSQLQTRYFFPSKTMEYLGSGTPTVMYKLDCLPKDYYSHVFFVEEETVESLRDKLVEVCEKDNEELRMFGELARQFILKEKNPQKQAEKIYNMLNDIQ